MQARWVIAVGVALWLCAPEDIRAQEQQVVSTDAGLQVRLPGSWTIEAGDGLVFANDAKEKVMMAFITSNYQDIGTLMTALGEELGRFVNNPTLDSDPDVDKINGLDRIRLKGAASLESGPVDLLVTVVTGGRRGLIVLTLGHVGTLDREVDAIQTSIERVPPLPSLLDTI